MNAPETNIPTLRPYLPATANFAAGKDSPREFLERAIATLEAWEPKIGAFVTLNLASARAEADRSTARWRAGKPLSSIDGMPIGIKDIIETIDMPTENGSPLFVGYRSERDGASVAALREAGALIVGKTVTTEFAATEPRGTRNPWDPARTPGGSSSGSAAAVGVGAITVGLGTQVIGSILRPSGFCGCYGFKPTVGALNRGGSYDGLSQSAHGTLAASLPEAWQVAYEIAQRAGGDPGFPGLYGPAKPPAAVKPKKLALLETDGWSVATKGAMQALTETLAKLAGGVTTTGKYHTISLNGIVLLAQVMDFSKRGSDLYTLSSFTTLASVARYHGTAQGNVLGLAQYVEQVRRFVANDYVPALFTGAALGAADVNTSRPISPK